MGLNKIKTNASWGEASSSLNSNFESIEADLTKVKNATTRIKGYYSSLDSLKSSFPTATLGDIAYVDGGSPFYTYRWDGSSWVMISSTGGEGNVELGNYYKKNEIDDIKNEQTDKLNKNMSFRERLIFKRESPNLIDLNALNVNKAISGVGTIYSVSNGIDSISDWIHVYPDTPYIISGGYSNTVYSLYSEYGDESKPLSYGKIPKDTPFYFEKEGYVVLQIKDSAVAESVYATTQFEEGSVATPFKAYSSVVYLKIDDRFLPEDIARLNDEGRINTELFDKKVMTESEYVIKISDSKNLIILENAQYNTAISGTGALYSTSSYNISSDWIPVKGGATYYLSGGYASNQVVLFKNYGDTSNPLAYDEINGWDGTTYTPIADGYVVLEIADSSSATADRSSTIQFEEGTIASPYQKGGEVRKYFNPAYIESDSSINLFDEKAKSELVEARIDFDTKEIINEAGNYCTPKLPLPNSDFIYVSGLCNSSSERVCLFYDGDTVNYWKFKTYGDSFKIPVNGACTHFVLWFKASDESLDLGNVFIGGLPSTYKEGVCTDTFKQVFEHKNEVVIPLDVDSDLGEIVVTSENNLDNVLIPVHVHYSSKPRYAVDRFDHVYLGSGYAGLKEDISFSLDGEILRSRRFGGNYTFVPTSNSRFLYFNAQFTHNGVSKIIGSYNGDNGVFVKDDINGSWNEIIPSAKFGYIDSNLDIYYKKGTELYCANIDNLGSPTLIYTSPSTSFFIDFDCFTETDDYVFFGTYQNEWDTKVYRISKADKTANICFDTAQKQHVHKILAIDNVIYLCCDGATANNANFDTYPTHLTKGMATFKSSDFGETWSTVQFPWSADYGVIGYHDGWYYGSAEASIKYAPSLFRSKDLRTWEIVENMPATAGGTFRVCDKGFIQSSMSSGFLTHNVIKFSADGKKFVPVFDKRVISSAISTGLKPTHNYNNTIVIDGNKCVLLNDQSQTLENAYIFNESGYTVFAYIQADLKAGDNVIKIHKGGCIKDIEPSKAYMPSHVTMTSADMLVDGSMEGVSINSVAVPSNIDGFSIPYKLEKQHGIMADVDVKKNANIHVGTLAFSIKEFSYFEGKPYLLLDFGTLKIYRNKSKLQLMEYGKIAAECVLGSMGYYSNVSSRVHITFDDNIKVYVNGKLNSTTSNTTDFPRGITQVSIRNADSSDFVSNICLYASAMKEAQVIRDFEGFNLI